MCDSYKTKNRILNNLPFFRVSLWLSDASLNFLRGGGRRRRCGGGGLWARELLFCCQVIWQQHCCLLAALKRMPCISEKPGAYSEIPRTSFSLERNHWSVGLCAAPPASPLPRYILRVTAYWLEGLFQKIAHNLRSKRFLRKTEETFTECWGQFDLQKKAHFE